MVGLVEVKDHVIWLKHIKNDDELVIYLDNFKQGVVISLSVDNKIGVWEKMADAAKGVSTNGIKPVGQAKKDWADIYKNKIGNLVSISRA